MEIPLARISHQVCSAALQSGCSAGLQTRVQYTVCAYGHGFNYAYALISVTAEDPLWRFGNRQHSRSGERRYKISSYFL
jgi:hypothetical protein